MDRHCERRRAAIQFALLFAAAATVRFLLSQRFYGWEEGDYGNLMMIREVIDSRFTWFRTAHMPGWYSMAALVNWSSDDPRVPALCMTLLFSSLNVAVAGLLARKLLSPAAGWLAGSWLVFQPEMALYGASTLRSPVFTSIAFLGMAFLVWGGRARGFGLTALAFLVRMEAFFSFYVPALWSWIRDRGQGLRRIGMPLVLLFGVVLGWQAYISLVQERCLGVEFNLEDIDRCWETAFMLGPVGVNLAPDVHGGSGGFDLTAWLQQGLWTAWALLTWTLPRKISWTILVAAAIGLWAMLRGTGRPGSATVALYALFALGIWLLEGFLAHHSPNHNLYWVWLLPAIPFLAVLGAGGWFAVDRRLAAAPRALRVLVFAALLASPAQTFLAETDHQLTRAEGWYRPQLELSRWMEDSLPSGTGVLVSSIPEVWLKRNPAVSLDPKVAPKGQVPGLRVYSWWKLPDENDGQPSESPRVSVEKALALIPAGTPLHERYQQDPGSIPWNELPAQLQDLKLTRVGNYLKREEIHYVMWFEEDWNEAKSIAPFLGYSYDQQGRSQGSQQRSAGPVLLTPVDWTPPTAEQGYGWILYVVTDAETPQRPVPPSFARGEKGSGWG